jgi:hypothetical protein
MIEEALQAVPMAYHEPSTTELRQLLLVGLPAVR